MRVNEIVARVGEYDLLQTKDLSRNMELMGNKKNIVENEEFKNLKLGNLLVTYIHLDVSHDDPMLVPVMMIYAEK